MTSPAGQAIAQAEAIAEATRDCLNAIAEDIWPGAVTFAVTGMTWVDDGDDTVTIRIAHEGVPDV